jgi:hypothetical protein
VRSSQALWIAAAATVAAILFPSQVKAQKLITGDLHPGLGWVNCDTQASRLYLTVQRTDRVLKPGEAIEASPGISYLFHTQLSVANGRPIPRRKADGVEVTLYPSAHQRFFIDTAPTKDVPVTVRLERAVPGEEAASLDAEAFFKGKLKQYATLSAQTIRDAQKLAVSLCRQKGQMFPDGRFVRLRRDHSLLQRVFSDLNRQLDLLPKL